MEMLRKIFTVIILSILITTIGCGKNGSDQSEETFTETYDSAETAADITASTAESSSASIVTSSAAETETTVFSGEKYEEPEIFPKLDGSTSTIPLEAGIRAAFLGIPLEEAEAQVEHTTTWQSFRLLMNWNTNIYPPDSYCDGLLSVPLSSEQKQMLEDEEIELEMIPLAIEGFVFIVNKNNPVDSLTTEQLRKIYSGEITNWNELGGNDATIKAYQRNNDSGSQNFMIDFMGDAPLTDAPTEYRPASMQGLTEIIASFDFGIDSIGYSVYTYAADMYSGANELKFIKIDGVAPNHENFKNGSYPATGFTYLMFDKRQPEDSLVRKLAAFLETPEGKEAIETSGYVLYENINAMPDTLLGTGPQKPRDLSAPSVEYIYSYSPWLNEEPARLKDKELEKRITDDIKRALPHLTDDEIWVPYECRNGYISFRFDDECFTYDLYTGNRLGLTDLFFEGEAFVPKLNKSIIDGFQNNNARSYEPEMEIHFNHDFMGIESNTQITLNSLIFPKDSVYFDTMEEELSIDPDYTVFAPAYPRDMKGIWEDDSFVTERYIRYIANDFYANSDCDYGLFPENGGPISDDVRKKANEFILSFTNAEAIKKFIGEGIQVPEERFDESDFPASISATYTGFCLHIGIGVKNGGDLFHTKYYYIDTLKEIDNPDIINNFYGNF